MANFNIFRFNAHTHTRTHTHIHTHTHKRHNEDQATCVVGSLNIPPSSQINNNTKKSCRVENGRSPSFTSIQYIYIGLFDGHGGTGAALKASKELHQIVHEGLAFSCNQCNFMSKRKGAIKRHKQKNIHPIDILL